MSLSQLKKYMNEHKDEYNPDEDSQEENTCSCDCDSCLDGECDSCMCCKDCGTCNICQDTSILVEKVSSTSLKCEHYNNIINMNTLCCKKDYRCVKCHDQKEDHKIILKKKQIKCYFCQEEQYYNKYCKKCKIPFGIYTCFECNIFTNNSIYKKHCDKCQKCIEYASLHCNKCNQCYPENMDHIC